MFGIERKDLIPILYFENLHDGIILATVKCKDYNKFVSLPDIMEIENKLYGKTGWNSDRMLAYYKNNIKFGKVI